jgi:hypothetical protein
VKSIVVSAFLWCVAGACAWSQSQSFIGPFETTEEIERELDGCACRMGKLFVSSADGRIAWMKIGGRIQRLHLTSPEDIGILPDKFARRYSAHGIVVTVLFRRDKSAKPSAQSNESEAVKLRATITVQNGRTRRTVKASGFCAC